MGNKVLVPALSLCTTGWCRDGRLGEVISAAADMDLDCFVAAFKKISSSAVAARCTAYISRRDSALSLAKLLRLGNTRAGLSRRAAFELWDSVDCTRTKGALSLKTGHGYVLSSRRVLRDLEGVLARKGPAEHWRVDGKKGLVQVDAERRLWALR